MSQTPDKSFKEKISINEWLNEPGPRRVNLGCGPRNSPGWLGVDALDLEGVGVVADLNKGLRFLPDQSVDEISCYSLLEHIQNFDSLVTEICRVLKKTGICRIFVPHFSNPYFYSDHTHIRFFGLYTFYYFVEQKHQLKRKVPTFYGNTRIRVHSVGYVFTSPFRGRRTLKRLIGKLVNFSSFTKEFYEENLCFLVPCYGLNVEFGPDKPQ